ncbi:unnamed protein product [Caenorhabditis auriculariae]|uniref:Uncharacterized protein n=1 Tax=Caenorhabditis auriculariae TaxID=2777116 RepID=A0A8S1GR70_9PELO|nr:unnamed protein product [Caenorhabditis auriculariae]
MVAPSPYRTAIIDCVKSGMTNSEIVKKLKMTCKEGDVHSNQTHSGKKHEKDGKRIRNESRIDENYCQGQAEDDSLPPFLQPLSKIMSFRESSHFVIFSTPLQCYCR